MPGYSVYIDVTLRCIRTASFCTPRLREELSQLSLLALWGAIEIKGHTSIFWSLTSRIIEMLHDQVSHDYLHCGKTCY